jgi:hypothetical protein
MLLSEQIEHSILRIENEIEFLRKLAKEVKELENKESLKNQSDKPKIAKKTSKKEQQAIERQRAQDWWARQHANEDDVLDNA